MADSIFQYESDVYEIVQDYLSMNRPVEVKKLVPHVHSVLAKRKVNLNAKGVKKIVNSLLRKKLIVQGSRLLREELLENKKRKAIFEYICKHPAVYCYQIIKALDLANHVVVWHVTVLLDFHLINKTHIDNHMVFFEAKIDELSAHHYYYMRNPKSKAIIELLKNNENCGFSKTEFSRDLSMHPNTVKKYINALESIGLIKKMRENNINCYFLNEN